MNSIENNSTRKSHWIECKINYVQIGSKNRKVCDVQRRQLPNKKSKGGRTRAMRKTNQILKFHYKLFVIYLLNSTSMQIFCNLIKLFFGVSRKSMSSIAYRFHNSIVFKKCLKIRDKWWIRYMLSPQARHIFVVMKFSMFIFCLHFSFFIRIY